MKFEYFRVRIYCCVFSQKTIQQAFMFWLQVTQQGVCFIIKPDRSFKLQIMAEQLRLRIDCSFNQEPICTNFVKKCEKLLISHKGIV